MIAGQSFLLPQHRPLGPPHSGEKLEDRDQDGDDDTLQHPHENNAERANDSEDEFMPADREQAAQTSEVEKTDGGHDQDRRQGRLREVAHQSGEEEEHEDNNHG